MTIQCVTSFMVKTFHSATRYEDQNQLAWSAPNYRNVLEAVLSFRWESDTTVRWPCRCLLPSFPGGSKRSGSVESELQEAGSKEAASAIAPKSSREAKRTWRATVLPRIGNFQECRTPVAPANLDSEGGVSQLIIPSLQIHKTEG